MKKKNTLAVWALLGILLVSLSGCSSALDEQNKTTIEVKKDGTIASVIVESFDKDYYQQEELQNMILQEAVNYNKNHASDSIAVEKVEVKKQQAVVVMQYAAAEDYMAYNHKPLFVGTVSGAIAAGYSLEGTLHEAADETKTITGTELSAMGDKQIVIVTEPLQVKVYAPITYLSEGAVLVNKKMASVSEEKMAYIVF